MIRLSDWEIRLCEYQEKLDTKESENEEYRTRRIEASFNYMFFEVLVLMDYN